MRELTLQEVEEVSGAGLTGITAGLRFAGVAGALYTSFQVGYWIGTKLYEAACR